jgi:alkylation response protein AidB-like acyl-CoA dehydrogenase
MNFDFDDDQKALQKTVRGVLDRECPLARTREVVEGKARYPEALWQTVAEAGWLGTAIPERFGGAGLGHLELALVAEELGRALAPIPFTASVCMAAEALLAAGSEAQKERWLPKLASGEIVGTFALCEGAGRFADRASIRATFDDGKLTGTKFPVPDGDIADVAVVVANESGAPRLVIVDLSAGVTVNAVGSVDPSRAQARLEFANAPAERLGDGGAWPLVERLLDRAATLLAFEQLGGAARAFDVTRSFVMDRYVFGRPVASYQAIKHRLADLFVDLELARSHAYYAAWALSTGDRELPVAAAAARAAASEAFDLAAVEAVHMHGGIGFTWEADCHLFVRRAKALGLALGPASEWRDKLVRRLAA